jgi:hypothetical protein
MDSENELRKLLSMYFEDYMLDDLLWDLSVDPGDLIIAGIKHGVLNREKIEEILLDE